MKATIKGQVPSKSNSYKIGGFNGRCTMYKGGDLKAYESLFLVQLPKPKELIDVPFKFTAKVYFRSRRSDLDNSLKIILDCLQLGKVVKNDNLCYEIHIEKGVDKENPRIEFEITKL